jgi:MFS family permease
MQPYTREIIDRRQPAMRWSAVFAGTAVASGIWILLQIFGMGAGLVALDRGAAIGSTVWALLAPLIAMFVGAWIAGKLSGFRDDKLGMLHGVVVWALTSVLAVLATVSLVSALAGSHTTVVVTTTDTAGKALLAGGTSMLLSLGTALLGGLLAMRSFDREHEHHRHTTMQTPVVPPPAGVDTSGY